MLSRVGRKKTLGLLKTVKRGYQVQRLHFHDEGSRNSISGVKCTLFGATSPLGAYIGGELSAIGSVMVYPHRATGDFHNPVFREIRVVADLGYKTGVRVTDFTDQREIDVTLKHSNVAICCIGSRRHYKTQKQFEDSNIRIPMTIAKAVRDHGDIKRFIYISAAGADPNSPSRRLRTKWIGEQEVKQIFPEVTVLRPTNIFNMLEPGNSHQGKWGMMMKMFNRTMFKVDGANALTQPVFGGDISLAVQNCLKMDETIGQTYELGGPHVYTYNELYEIYYSTSIIRPYVIPIKLETLWEWAHSPQLSSIYRYAGKYWMYPEFLCEESVDVVVDKNAKTFEDLYVKPISFGQKVKDYIAEIYWYNNSVGDTMGKDAVA